jgi:signal transduction histidine kinase
MGSAPPPAAAPASSRPWLVDVGAATAVVAALVLVTTHIPVAAGERRLDALGVVLLVAAGGAMGLCRRHPAPAVAITAAALCAYLVRDHPGGPIYLTGWFALASLSWRRGRAAGLGGAVVLCGALVAATATEPGGTAVVHLVNVGWSIAAVLAGEVLRGRSDRAAQLLERTRDLERSRAEAARRQTAEERLQIARDLHDSVAHAMATINVQAGAAAHVVDRRPAAATEALVAIQRASGDVLDELAALVALLRSADEPADRAPTPGIDRIPALVAASLDGAGLDVALTIDGPLDRVAVPVGTAAYRIVQESLTNVIRHGGSSPVAVTVAACGGGDLVVEVVDGGRPTSGATTSTSGASRGTGTGIEGMRERAEATGGTLTAGPRAGGGWAVRAAWAHQ